MVMDGKRQESQLRFFSQWVPAFLESSVRPIFKRIFRMQERVAASLSGNAMFPLFRFARFAAVAITVLYLGLLGLLTTTTFQSHAIYLNAIEMTWGKDLDVPEIFGFLRNQVTPFRISSNESESLHSWLITPLELYRRHEANFLAEISGLDRDISSRLTFELLREDPDAILVIHFHGAGGTVASGYRCPNYRALAAGRPDKIHVLTFDYRGFGRSPGTPSEQGIIADALTVVNFALNTARIPATRIAMFSQSLGTAVNVAVAEHYAQRNIVFAGHVLVAPFVDVPTLVSTYRIAGVVPLLSPLSHFPVLFDYLRSWIQDTWATKDRLASYVRANEARGNKYFLTLIHAKDDFDIPWRHTTQLFWHGVNASSPNGVTPEALDRVKLMQGSDLGPGGSVLEWRTDTGIIREEILRYGLHDVLMGSSVITLAIMRIIG